VIVYARILSCAIGSDVEERRGWGEYADYWLIGGLMCFLNVEIVCYGFINE